MGTYSNNVQYETERRGFYMSLNFNNKSIKA